MNGTWYHEEQTAPVANASKALVLSEMWNHEEDEKLSIVANS